MNKVIGFTLVSVGVVGAYFVGQATRTNNVAPTSATAPSDSAPADGVERKKAIADGASKGPADALVTMVEWSDFQCPFCSKVVPTVDQLFKENPGKIRVVFRHYPLPFHQNAHIAAEAAEAAREQGKFWEMHDKMFANQQALTRPDLEKYAQEFGLDMTKFKGALDSGKFKKHVDDDMAAGSAIGVSGTPNVFVNGRLLAGAYPYDEFKKIVDDELVRAQKLLAKGVPAKRVYEEFMKMAGQAPAAKPAAAAAGQAPAVPTDVYKAEVGGAPTKGAKEPKVTIVAYSEFQCPFCSRVVPTLKQVLDTYKNDVQVAFKHLPLDFHQNAMPAAMAAEAAREQGKFWEMHDKMFENQQALERSNLDAYAQQIGLDMGKFKAFVDGGKGKERIEADKAQAAKLGARGTPSFFVNGRSFVGAQPFDNFKALIDEEITKADQKLKAGVARKDLYVAIIKDGKDAPPPPPPAPAAAAAPTAGTVYKAEIAGAPMKGAKDALVTIVQYSDFQCPFCTRVEPTMDKILTEYKGKVRVVWRDFPLDFHQNATPAAIAARAAGEQGKFWEMHKKLFENQQSLDGASLEKYGQELGLNMGKFKASLGNEKLKAAVSADAASGAKIGVRGTPAFFVNGRFLSGAQPFEAFKALIDEESKKAEELVKKGTPKAKVYDAILKGAQTQVAAAPAGGPAEEAGPEVDKTVHKIDPGKSPAKGPKNAALTVVVFSDFECPFCSRVEPTITQLEKEYQGKVRVVWKNYPLPFHQNAKPAAIAALAAGEQGKFWEMHDKLFANQRALDGASLEKYAQELGLNMGKFKSSMGDSKLAQQVDDEAKEGAAIGVQGTPATFINGRKIGGAYPFPTFKAIAEQELARGKTKTKG